MPLVIRGIQAIQWTGPRQCHGMPAQRRQFRGRGVSKNTSVVPAPGSRVNAKYTRRGVRAPGELASVSLRLRSKGSPRCLGLPVMPTCPSAICVDTGVLRELLRVGRAGHQRRLHDRAGRTDTARRNHRKPDRDRVGARAGSRWPAGNARRRGLIAGLRYSRHYSGAELSGLGKCLYMRRCGVVEYEAISVLNYGLGGIGEAFRAGASEAQALHGRRDLHLPRVRVRSRPGSRCGRRASN